MASSTIPTHGKLGALYVLRPNGYEGVAATLGLNDVTWGVADAAAASALYVVAIDASVPSPDTFVWTVNGGGGAGGVAITGAAQAVGLDGQMITFAAVDGHTIGDAWTIGNLHVEPTTIAGNTAQITAAASRIINPNAPPVFTPTNAVNLLSTNYTTGMATFDGAPGVTTVEGNNGMVPRAALQKVAYLMDWNLNFALDMVDASRSGQAWKEALPGQAGASGGANSYFIGTQTMYWNLAQHMATSGPKYFFMELYPWDPAQDQTGDHYLAWVTCSGFSLNTGIGEVVKEALSFQVFGEPSFMANV